MRHMNDRTTQTKVMLDEMARVRMKGEMHRSLSSIAYTRGLTLSQLIRRILEQYLKQRKAA